GLGPSVGVRIRLKNLRRKRRTPRSLQFARPEDRAGHGEKIMLGVLGRIAKVCSAGFSGKALPGAPQKRHNPERPPVAEPVAQARPRRADQPGTTSSEAATSSD